MKKRNLMFALCAAGVLGLVGCKNKEKEKEEEEKPATKITQEVVDNTVNAMKSDFKATVTSELEYNDDVDTVGLKCFDKSTLIEKHHFEGTKKIVESSGEYAYGSIINTKEYLAAEGQTQEMLDDIDASEVEDGYTKTVDGDVITYTKTSQNDTDYVESVNEYSHMSYDYYKNKGKYEKYLGFRGVDDNTMAGQFKEMLCLLVDKGTYDKETDLFVINNDDLPVNSFSIDYKVIFSVKVENKIATELIVNDQEEPDSDPFLETIKLDFGAQTVTLPSDEKVIASTCTHDGDKSYEYRTYNGKLYELETCEECWDYTLFTECTVDENGLYKGHEIEGEYLERVFDHFIADISYNLVTKKIIDVEIGSCYDEDGYYGYYYWVGETKYTIEWTAVYKYNDSLCAKLDYVDDSSVQHFILLKDVAVDDETYTITGTTVKEYCSGQVLSI